MQSVVMRIVFIRRPSYTINFTGKDSLIFQCEVVHAGSNPKFSFRKITIRFFAILVSEWRMILTSQHRHLNPIRKTLTLLVVMFVGFVSHQYVDAALNETILYLGCYNDDITNTTAKIRDFNYMYNGTVVDILVAGDNLAYSNETVSSCNSAAMRFGYHYFALRDGGMCLLGDDFPGIQGTSYSCSSKCIAVDPQTPRSEICGGTSSISAFKAGATLPSCLPDKYASSFYSNVILLDAGVFLPFNLTECLTVRSPLGSLIIIQQSDGNVVMYRNVSNSFIASWWGTTTNNNGGAYTSYLSLTTLSPFPVAYDGSMNGILGTPVPALFHLNAATYFRLLDSGPQFCVGKDTWCWDAMYKSSDNCPNGYTDSSSFAIPGVVPKCFSITSPSNTYSLRMQDDGNLVSYILDPSHTYFYNSGTWGATNSRNYYLQLDHNIATIRQAAAADVIVHTAFTWSLFGASKMIITDTGDVEVCDGRTCVTIFSTTTSTATTTATTSSSSPTSTSTVSSSSPTPTTTYSQTVSNSDLCRNTLIDSLNAQILMIPLDREPLLYEPTVSGIFDLCPAYNGQQTCCGLHALVAISKVKQVIHQTLMAMQMSNTFGNSSTIATALCKVTGFGSSICNEAQSYIVHAQAASERFSKHAVECTGALEGYMTGMLCFSCSVNAASYLSGNTIKIHINTCKNVAGYCAPLNQDYLDYIHVLDGFSALIVSVFAFYVTIAYDNKNTLRRNPQLI